MTIDGKPQSWSSYRATTDADVSIEGAVVGDRDRIRFEIPEGNHSVGVNLLAGTSERFLARIRYPEPVSKEEPEEGEQR